MVSHDSASQLRVENLYHPEKFITMYACMLTIRSLSKRRKGNENFVLIFCTLKYYFIVLTYTGMYFVAI